MAASTRARSAKPKDRTADTPQQPAEIDAAASSPDAAPVTAPVEDKPLVDLDEGTIDQPDVRFRGKTYKIRVLDDFGIRAQQRLTREGREFFALWTSDEELSDSDGERLEELLQHMFDEVFSAPASVKKQLSDGQKAQIVLGFTLAPVAQRTKDLERQQAAMVASQQ